MSRTKVVQRISKNDISDDMSHMFKQMMGEETPDYSIIKPKYDELLVIITNLSTLLLKFTNLIEKHVPEYAKCYADMRQYSGTLTTVCKNYDMPKLPSMETTESSKEQWTAYIETVSKQYLALKKDSHIKNLVIVCKDLSVYSKHLKDTDKLSANFIYESSDPDVCVLRKITQLPFKQLYLSEKISKSPGAQSYILTFLHMFLVNTQRVFQLLSSPDINIDKFVTIISGAIGQMKNHPELRGCDGAFKEILKSTNMLKDNFNVYYGNFMSSNNPNIIMEDFISDVSRKVEGNTRMVMQFKRIMGFYRKQLQKQKNVSPQIMGMMNFVGSKLDKLDAGDDSPDSPEETLPEDTPDNATPAEASPAEATSTTSATSATSATSSTSATSATVEESPVRKVQKKKGK